MRSLADQTVAELGGRLSVLTRQKADHVELDRLLLQLADTEPSRQGPVLRRIYRLVFPHAFAEESVLWPVFRRVLTDGADLTLRIEREHQQVNELVTELEGLAIGDERRPGVLARLVATLSEDVRDEEDVLLPQVQAVVGPATLRALGVAWELVRRVAPTRAHPEVSRRPPGNALAAAPLSVLDRLRDRVDTQLERRPDPAVSRWTTVSRGLTTLSHRVGQLAAFRRGEDSSTAAA